MAANTKDSMSPGPAYLAAPIPVRTKIPVPMMIPSPMRVMSKAPNAFVSFFSWVWASKSSKDLRRNRFIYFPPFLIIFSYFIRKHKKISLCEPILTYYNKKIYDNILSSTWTFVNIKKTRNHLFYHDSASLNCTKNIPMLHRRRHSGHRQAYIV